MNGSSPPLFAKPRPAQTVIWGRKDGFGHLGTGFPPRQLLTSPRKGPADPNFTAYVSAEVVSGLAPPLPLKVFPPGPGARYVRVQEPKPQQSPRASAKELHKAELPPQPLEEGAMHSNGAGFREQPMRQASQDTPALPQRHLGNETPGSSPTNVSSAPTAPVPVPGLPLSASTSCRSVVPLWPTATHVFHASPRLLSSRVHLASPPVSARAQPSPQALPQSPNLSQTFPMHLSQTIQPMQLTQSHSSQPTLLTQTTQATQPTQQILPTKLAQPTQTPHPTQPTQPNKPSHLPQPPSQPPQPPQPLQPLQPAQSPQLCSSGTPVVPAPDLGLRNHSLDQMSQTYGNLPWVDVGTWTPPPSHMSRSASTQPSQRRELRPASPLPNRLGDLGGTMRSASPISRFDGVRISPSPLSARQLPAPRSGSPLQTRAQAVDAPAMLRQRTLPCDLGLPPDRTRTFKGPSKAKCNCSLARVIWKHTLRQAPIPWHLDLPCNWDSKCEYIFAPRSTHGVMGPPLADVLSQAGRYSHWRRRSQNSYVQGVLRAHGADVGQAAGARGAGVLLRCGKPAPAALASALRTCTWCEPRDKPWRARCSQRVYTRLLQASGEAKLSRRGGHSFAVGDR
ncbi:unnamed protein product [Effrenium voratum]|nr:unnamed protein product [Effrenium voratum]